MFGKKKTEEVKKEEQKYTWQQNVALYLHDMICMLVAALVLLALLWLIETPAVFSCCKSDCDKSRHRTGR